MAEIHNATASTLVDELVSDVTTFAYQQLDNIARESAAICPNDPYAAAKLALQDLTAEMSDHLQIDFAVTLTAFTPNTPKEDR